MRNSRVIITVPNEPNNERNTKKEDSHQKKEGEITEIQAVCEKNANFFLSVKHFFFNGLNLRLYRGWRKYFSFNFFFLFLSLPAFFFYKTVSINHIYTLLLITRQGRFLWRWGKAAVPNAIRSIILFFLCVSHAENERTFFQGWSALEKEATVLMNIHRIINKCWQFWWEF